MPVSLIKPKKLSLGQEEIHIICLSCVRHPSRGDKSWDSACLECRDGVQSRAACVEVVDGDRGGRNEVQSPEHCPL